MSEEVIYVTSLAKVWLANAASAIMVIQLEGTPQRGTAVYFLEQKTLCYRPYWSVTQAGTGDAGASLQRPTQLSPL